MPITPFAAPDYTPSTVAPEAFDTTASQRSHTAPAAFTPAASTPSTTPPTPFTAAAGSPSTTPPTAFTTNAATASTTPPTAFTSNASATSTTPPQTFSNDLTVLADIAALKALATTTLDPAASDIVRDVKSTTPGETRTAWLLVAGVHADDVANGFAQPADYNASTNAKYWKRIL